MITICDTSDGNTVVVIEKPTNEERELLNRIKDLKNKTPDPKMNAVWGKFRKGSKTETTETAEKNSEEKKAAFAKFNKAKEGLESANASDFVTATKEDVPPEWADDFNEPEPADDDELPFL